MMSINKETRACCTGPEKHRNEGKNEKRSGPDEILMDRKAAVMSAQMSPSGTCLQSFPVKAVMNDMEGTKTVLSIQQGEDVTYFKIRAKPRNVLSSAKSDN